MKSRFLRALRDTVMPPDLRCALCADTAGVIGGHGLCRHCYDAMRRAHGAVRLADRTCAVSVFLHEEGAAKLVYALKYGGDGYAAYALGSFMADCAQPYADKDAVLVPVAQHARRYLSRGYNQSVYLARQMAELLNLPLCRALMKTRATPHQTGLRAEARRRNLQGAFAVRTRAKKRVAGRTVLLIDDVMTTGATLRACAQALIDVGARRVVAVTATRTPRRAVDEPNARFTRQMRGAEKRMRRLAPVRQNNPPDDKENKLLF